MCGVFDFFDDLGVVGVVENEFGFHFEDLVFEEAADFLVFGVEDSEEKIVDLQFVVVLSLDLAQSALVKFGENLQELTRRKPQLPNLIVYSYIKSIDSLELIDLTRVFVLIVIRHFLFDDLFFVDLHELFESIF